MVTTWSVPAPAAPRVLVIENCPGSTRTASKVSAALSSITANVEYWSPKERRSWFPSFQSTEAASELRVVSRPLLCTT